MWQAALARKITQQAHPLDASVARAAKQIVVVRGAADQSVGWAAQQTALTEAGYAVAPHGAGGPLGASYARIHEIAGAGHALPWTRAQDVASIISSDLRKI